ncbi:OsmC family protein [Paracoccus tegillarcae]|uniref:Peroxiredoxin n=1 Tax=Paracoccus tegillarcae TaxID=1529068 RepID=A0A2K9ET39_9RHOB|nr:OsmC family protein [Paracoccus tegillarcae]AUH34016.1 peroxiredoxin [Paracoccus tegillarcae]
MITRTGSAKWEGDLKSGKGVVSTQSGVLDDQPYGFNTRFQDGSGTNPEELIGAAHAACFSMALANMLGEAGIGGVSVETTSKITLDADSLTVTKAHLVTSITADGDKAQVEKLAQDAKDGCPISKLLNAEVTMEASVS